MGARLARGLTVRFKADSGPLRMNSGLKDPWKQGPLKFRRKRDAVSGLDPTLILVSILILIRAIKKSDTMKTATCFKLICISVPFYLEFLKFSWEKRWLFTIIQCGYIAVGSTSVMWACPVVTAVKWLVGRKMICNLHVDILVYLRIKWLVATYNGLEARLPQYGAF